MLGQAVAEIPELKEVNEDFFADLEVARTRGEIDIAIERYKRRLDDLRARRIIRETQYKTLRFAIPMRADFAWATKSKEVGTPAEVRAGVAEKLPGEWALEKGYIKEAEEVGLLDVLKHFPEALKEVAAERLREFAGIIELKIPRWAWLLVGLGAFSVLALFAGGFFLRRLKE